MLFVVKKERKKKMLFYIASLIVNLNKKTRWILTIKTNVRRDVHAKSLSVAKICPFYVTEASPRP